MTGGIGAASVGQIIRKNFDISYNHVQRHKNAARESRDDLNIAQAVSRLQRQNDQLKLYVASAVSLLIRKGLITSEEFEKLSDIIDRADGVADGRFSGTIKPDGSLTTESDYDDRALRELAKAVQGLP